MGGGFSEWGDILQDAQMHPIRVSSCPLTQRVWHPSPGFYPSTSKNEVRGSLAGSKVIAAENTGIPDRQPALTLRRRPVQSPS